MHTTGGNPVESDPLPCIFVLQPEAGGEERATLRISLRVDRMHIYISGGKGDA